MVNKVLRCALFALSKIVFCQRIITKTVNLAIEHAEKCGLNFQGFQIIADDLNADSTAECSQPAWQILYTTHLQSCSPLHNGDDFSPIPLYKQLKNQPHLSQDLIKMAGKLAGLRSVAN